MYYNYNILVFYNISRNKMSSRCTNGFNTHALIFVSDNILTYKYQLNFQESIFQFYPDTHIQLSIYMTHSHSMICYMLFDPISIIFLCETKTSIYRNA